MCVRILTLALVARALWLGASRATDQSLRGTLVLPVLDFRSATPDARDARAGRAAELVQATLVERDPSPISLHDARDRFMAPSRPPVAAEEGDVDVLARQARAALEHVAFGRTACAQRSVIEGMTRAEPALESLNRETAACWQRPLSRPAWLSSSARPPSMTISRRAPQTASVLLLSVLPTHFCAFLAAKAPKPGLRAVGRSRWLRHARVAFGAPWRPAMVGLGSVV